MKLPQDRWLEMSLAWFRPHEAEALDSQAARLMQRIAPLYRNVGGSRGLLIGHGLHADPMLTWAGDMEQPFTVVTPRLAHWRSATYRDLAHVYAAIRSAAAAEGIDDLCLGLLTQSGLFVSPEDDDNPMYSFRSAVALAHPELVKPLPEPGTNLSARIMAGDQTAYAAFPHGVPDGITFGDYFAAQWGAFAEAFGLEALMLRDGWYTASCYSKKGPFGPTASPDPAKNHAWTAELDRFLGAVKAARPEALLIGYSYAAGSVAQWRVAAADLESLIARGHFDVWIDQTWGGAWQDWWSWETIGWTMQHAYHLLQAAMIAKANESRAVPCRHWNLIETWDGWEPWDTLHQVPGKLRWAMWAFSHATVLTPRGPKVPDGAYISWINSRHFGSIWSEEDVRFVGSNLDAAQKSAAALEVTYGPTAVYHREVLEEIHQNDPAGNYGEWIDEQTGMLAKWGFPCLSATRSEWLDDLPAVEGLVAQLPDAEHPRYADAVLRAIYEGVPVVVTGRADKVDPRILDAIGLERGQLDPGWFKVCRLSEAPANVGTRQDEGDLPSWNVIHYPPYVPVTSRGAQRGAGADDGRAAEPLLSCDDSLLLAANRAGNALYWIAPDWFEPFDPVHRRTQIGSFAPYALVVRYYGQAAARRHALYVEDVPYVHPVAVHAWRSAGSTYVLAGNLETGVVGDGRTPRRLVVHVPRPRGAAGEPPRVAVTDGDDGARVTPLRVDDEWISLDIEVPPEGSRLLCIGMVQ